MSLLLAIGSKILKATGASQPLTLTEIGSL